jgi:uncharacterized damage-inducible protein DinB
MVALFIPAKFNFAGYISQKMKTYFVNLFEYDRFANKVILDTILKAGNPEKPVKLMAHILAAQQIWLNRCKGLPVTGVVLWPDWPVGTLAETITQNTAAWLSYLEDSQPEDMEKLISYKDSKGNSWENTLSNVLTHVINHGTHHRAQAGQHLKFAGMENLPLTDYIYYVRLLNRQ